jgi:hypothetical protein
MHRDSSAELSRYWVCQLCPAASGGAAGLFYPVKTGSNPFTSAGADLELIPHLDPLLQIFRGFAEDHF